MGEVQMNINYERDKQEIKNIILYSFGKIISVFGTAIYSFALSLYVLKLTGSAFSFAITLVLGVIPAIIMNPFAGVIADKVNKKTLVVVMDFLSGILLVIVYFVCMNYELNLLIIYSTTFLLTVFSTFFGIGLEAAKPNVVSESMLMNINSISRILDSVSLILGPMLGGIVFVIFDIETFIIVNGVSFILSGFLMMCIHFKLFQDQSNEESSNGKIHWVRDIKDGFYYLIERKRIKNTFIIFIAINFFLGFAVTVPLPYIINTVLKLRSEEFGIIQAAFPVGMIVGALLVKKITEKIAYSTILKYVSISLSICMITLGIPVIDVSLQFASIAYVCFYVGIMLCLGICIACIDIPLMYFMQKEIPDEYRGRVLSIGFSIGKMMFPLAMITSGILLKLLPAYMIPITGGMAFLLVHMCSAKKMKVELPSKSMNI